jgi:hypothetical protein
MQNRKRFPAQLLPDFVAWWSIYYLLYCT